MYDLGRDCNGLLVQSDEVDAPFKPAQVEEAVKKSIKEYDDFKDNDQINSSTAGGEPEAIPYSLFGVGAIFRLIPLPVIPTNPQVIEIAKFAVKEGNERAGTDLKFVNVVLGIKWSVYLATFYMIGIKLKRSTDGKIHLRDAKVVEAVTGHKKLLSWD
ncbi:hypothetical protein ACH5RR_017490 [Cinchona calisaya]|uniref:Cystatin domain-containing protein n=1 Tax=Cinchona calisaya TaxID=153742 RepID=A0ABD2ZKG5_9GENT